MLSSAYGADDVFRGACARSPAAEEKDEGGAEDDAEQEATIC